MERLETTYGVLLRNDHAMALFDPSTLKLFNVDLPLSLTLADVDRHLAGDAAVCTSPPAAFADEPSPAAQVLPSRRRALLPVLAAAKVVDGSVPSAAINRLTLNISNACNLWCSYCYADHGFYHAPKSLMAPETAAAVVHRILEHYEDVEIVHFFGGEPLLNLRAINAVALAFESVVAEGRLKRLPQFVATTNGTLSSNAVLETLERWRIDLTVSCDGPQVVHDAARPMASGTGSSFQKLSKSLERFDARGIHYGLECTYNAQHRDLEISVRELLDFFSKLTNQREFHIAPVSLPRSEGMPEGEGGQRIFRGESLVLQKRRNLDMVHLIEVFREAAVYTVQNVFSGDGPVLSLANGIIGQIVNRRPSQIYCPAFFDQLSVATDGSVFPCFMFIGDDSFNLGNILTGDYPSARAAEVIGRYFREFGFSPVGTNNWYGPLFSGCVAGEYITSNSLGVRTMAPLYEAMIEECLLGVAASVRSGMPTPSVEHQLTC